MRLLPLILFAAGLAANHPILAQAPERERYEIDRIGDAFAHAYFWRTIPSQLAERCEKIAATDMRSVRVRLENWNSVSADTVDLIDQLLPRVACQFADIMGRSPEQVQQSLVDEAMRQIDAQFFDPKDGPDLACSKYGDILDWLGSPGMAATSRGHAYFVESMLARREKRP